MAPPFLKSEGKKLPGNLQGDEMGQGETGRAQTLLCLLITKPLRGASMMDTVYYTV